MDRDVDEAVLGPMVAAFAPPRHLRGDPAAVEAALALYRQALGRFPRPVLERAWRAAAENHPTWAWPTPADVLRQAERLAARVRRDGPAWVEEAVRLADAYTRRFLQANRAAARARDGGYEGRLRAYVWEAAYVQAQRLAGRADGLNYDAVLFAHLDDDDRRAAMDEFFARAEAQAARGFVRVAVPAAAVRRWEQEATTPGAGRAR